ncbi:DUF1566 domain-containing protein [Legionella waltersii]|uniref:Legionella vir region protein n=1 Tax=Legionella waltersii TaxID=66969 RepID=A0A0W1AN82_9GAMM|nr:DUF1566 domain-containing protein [Legionella waltersii]KTD82781.1 hypothetical protein Lwal_0259 [Legionella waltersii]SNV01289.1 lvrE [Legionella waltersii]
MRSIAYANLLFCTSLEVIAATPISTVEAQALIDSVTTRIDALNAQVQSNPAFAHPIGSCYGGGVVFYVNPDATAAPGNQGIIAALTDATGVAVPWSTGGTGPSTQTGYFGGQLNTVNKSGGAFASATGFNGGGFSDWYLPSIFELGTMYSQARLWDSTHGAGNFWTHCAGVAFSNASYWSSSTSLTTANPVPSFAWSINGNTGFVSQATVGVGTALVRAVRAF